MDNPSFENVQVVLYNPTGQMRATLRDALLSIGFRNIFDTGDLARARSAVVEQSPDIILVDLDRDMEEVCDLSRDIRHGRLANDPYVVIMGLTWQANMQKVNFSLEAGIDDVVNMPISLKLIRDRINNLIKNRKPFVVTPSYIGPDRRTAERRDDPQDEIGTLQVPNNLRFKALGDETAAASADKIGATQDLVQTHRLSRYAQRIVWLLGNLKERRDGATPTPREIAECLDEVDSLIYTLSNEVGTLGYGALYDICDSMTRVMVQLRKTNKPRFYELMRVHAYAITATLMDRDGAGELVIEALNDATDRLSKPVTPQPPRRAAVSS